MSYHEGLAALTARALNLVPEGDISFEDLIEEEVETEALAELWLLYDEYRAAANRVEKILNDELGRRMKEEDSRFSIGDWQVFLGYRSTSEKCIDADGFWQVILADPDQVPRYFNPNVARMGSLPPSVRDTFFEKTRPPKAEKMAVAAPAQVLEDARTKRELRERAS